MIKVFIVDDHPIVIKGLLTALEDDPNIQVVGQAESSRDCFLWFEENHADVVLLDIHLDEMDGIEVCKQLIKKMPELGIIGLTTYDQISFVNAMVKNGAKGYLYKNTSEEELMEAIKTVYAGREFFSREVYQKLIHQSNKNRSRSFIPKITRREKEVLQLIYDEYTNQEIAKKLFLSVSTIETHRMNLCTKLNVRNTAGLIREAIKFGFV